MPVTAFDRRTALARLAALGIGASTPFPRLAAAQTPLPQISPAIRGVCYDVGWGSPGALSRTIWNEDWMRAEVARIATDLGCTDILLMATDMARLHTAAEAAVSAGLVPWLQPRLMDGTWDETITQARQAAAIAEDLRRDGIEVKLLIGSELLLFTLDIVPGTDFFERMDAMYAEPGRFPEWIRQVNAFHARAVPAVRDVFGGTVTYAAAIWEAPAIDWSPFDIIGVNAYRTADNAATFAGDLSTLLASGKPVVATEFGCCCFRGAADLGGEGFNVIDWTATPPEVPTDLVYDPDVQATYIGDLLQVFAAAGLAGTFPYVFMEESPYSDEARYNFDLASFGIVRTVEDGTDRAYSVSGQWEPKPAYRRIAEWYRAR